jgi:hypothetical protein
MDEQPEIVGIQWFPGRPDWYELVRADGESERTKGTRADAATRASADGMQPVPDGDGTLQWDRKGKAPQTHNRLDTPGGPHAGEGPAWRRPRVKGHVTLPLRVGWRSIITSEHVEDLAWTQSVAAGDRMAEREIVSVVWHERDDLIYVTYAAEDPDRMVAVQAVAADFAREAGLSMVPAPHGICRWVRDPEIQDASR